MIIPFDSARSDTIAEGGRKTLGMDLGAVSVMVGGVVGLGLEEEADRRPRKSTV